MNKTVRCGMRTGKVKIPSSKSQAHRMLLCAALAQNSSTLVCDGISKDIEATIRCLRAMGASVSLSENGAIHIDPIKKIPQEETVLPCGESGSTLRFLIPVTGALGIPAVFDMEGNLPNRPLTPLDDELVRHGMILRKEKNRLHCKGKLTPGSYFLPGNISSQYISGLLFALPLLNGDSTLEITGRIESEDYIRMTEKAIADSGIKNEKKNNRYFLPGNQTYSVPASSEVEGDWSNAAFFFSAGALSSSGVQVTGLSPASVQGDKKILEILSSFGAEVVRKEDEITVRGHGLKGITLDASSVPDLVPVLCAVASAAEGTTVITHAERLKIKESDRIESTCGMLRSLGADIVPTDDGMIIHGKEKLTGGETVSYRDHRIAMAAAVAAGVCTEDVLIDGAECTEKSYPRFWEDINSLEVV